MAQLRDLGTIMAIIKKVENTNFHRYEVSKIISQRLKNNKNKKKILKYYGIKYQYVIK